MRPKDGATQVLAPPQAVNARPCFVVVNVMALAVGAAAWRAGLFAAVPALGADETAMLAGLAGVRDGRVWGGVPRPMGDRAPYRERRADVGTRLHRSWDAARS